MKYKVEDKINLEQALDLALDLASKGLGRVVPNPCVGAVLFNEETGELISFGYHEVFGGPHAEVNCFEGVESAEGLTLVVTLEPCSHHGKTPPCADLVIEKKPKKLVYITKDPNPLVAGKGLAKIKKAGIAVEQADEKYFSLNRKLNHKFFYAFENKKTYVHLKWAESADGYTSVKEGSPWITNKESQEHSHFLRAQSQAVLIGRGTLEKDDPSLNVRKKGYEKALKVLIFDTDLKSLSGVASKNICKVRDKKDIIFLCDKPSKDDFGYSYLALHKNLEGEWDLNRLTQDLYSKFGFQSIFVEGGAYTISQFIKQNEYSRLSIFRSPRKLGSNGEKPVEGLKIEGGDVYEAIEIDVDLDGDTLLDYKFGSLNTVV